MEGQINWTHWAGKLVMFSMVIHRPVKTAFEEKLS